MLAYTYEINSSFLAVPKFPTYSTLEKDQGMYRGLLLHKEVRLLVSHVLGSCRSFTRHNLTCNVKLKLKEFMYSLLRLILLPNIFINQHEKTHVFIFNTST